MIDVKKAVSLARDYFNELSGLSLGVELEEVELDEEAKEWIITFSYQMDAFPPQRAYKYVILNAMTGEFKALKFRSK